jgi:hypothetical protein
LRYSHLDLFNLRFHRRSHPKDNRSKSKNVKDKQSRRAIWNEFSSKETPRIRNKDSSKCSRDADMLRQSLKVKRRQKEEAMHMEEDTQKGW